MFGYYRPPITQRQVMTRITENGESATCPFCGKETTGEWLAGWLGPVDYCVHFMGFAAGLNGKPSAMFQGIN